MADVRPFRALRPRDNLAQAIIAPPYDVLTEAEARALAVQRQSFVRVTRSEVDLDAGTDPHSEAAYLKAKENLDGFVAEGWLVRDARPTWLVYGQQMGGHAQVGFLAGCSVAEYDRGDIAKHELTRPDEEDDRLHHMEVLGAQVGLVFLAYRPTAALDELLRRATAGPPAWAVRTDDGVVHRLWRVDAAQDDEVRTAFAAVPRLYVADGHHRSAAASRLHARRQDDASAYFLAGLYPSDRLQVLPYNRLVHDLNGRTPEQLLAEVARAFDVHPDGPPSPARRREFSMYLRRRWYRLLPKPSLLTDDPVRGLDVSLLQDHLLGPILGIDDPRRSERIGFLGGIHGPEGLVAQVDAGRHDLAFSLYPTSLEELFRVADAGMVMPPKSTWFEPKLREGVAIREL